MSELPTLDTVFEAMARASVGEPARVPVPADPDLDHPPTRLALALNILLEDLEARAAESRRVLEEVDRVKSAIINVAAHEFNTPLTPMRLQLHLLRGAKLGPLTEAQASALRMLERNVDHLVRLVSDMLDVALLQDGRLSVTPSEAELGGIVADAVEDLRPAAKAAGVEVHLPASPRLVVSADAFRIRQVVRHLVAFAVRSSRAGGVVEVGAGREAGDAVVRVVHAGPPLPAEQARRLFEPFVLTATESGAGPEGTGLGFFLSRGILELQGGRIWCETEGPRAGVSVAFSVPLLPQGSRSR